MNILAIETSCDETALCLANFKRKKQSVVIKTYANITLSQVSTHQKWGGVVPSLAQREHAKNIPVLLERVLRTAPWIPQQKQAIKTNTPPKRIENKKVTDFVHRISIREEQLVKKISTIAKKYTPSIDAIAVTHGPGLEPALWTGINAARTLSIYWDIPLIPVNHLEGHFYSPFITQEEKSLFSLTLPPRNTLALIVSGGHTQLVFSPQPGIYQILGSTRDDAAGEAFDKVARILSLPYPGGPAISEAAKKAKNPQRFNFPSPMIHVKNFDFSFSGLKTAVLYTARAQKKLSSDDIADMAAAFQNAAVKVLVSKTLKALSAKKARAIALGGGVAANELLRSEIKREVTLQNKTIPLFLPMQKITGDNALMIAAAGFLTPKKKWLRPPAKDVRAHGTLPLR